MPDSVPVPLATYSFIFLAKKNLLKDSKMTEKQSVKKDALMHLNLLT